MTKKALLEEAQELGLEVTEKDTKAEIQEAIGRRLDEAEKVIASPELNNIETEPIPEQVIPVSYEDHIKAGFVNLSQSEGLQKQGKRVVEIKNIGGFILHRLEKI